MSLTDWRPPPPLLEPGVPFLLTAWWPIGSPAGATIGIAAVPYPGAYPREYAISGDPIDPITEVHPHELPIALALVPDPWRFTYLGGPEFFAIPEAGSEAPEPQSAEQLREGAEQLLRESVGIPAEEPLPEPRGPLSAREAVSEPYRFDPTPHMDLATAEPPPPIPPPAPPGPDPLESPRMPAPVPDKPGKPLGAFGEQSVPFAH